MGFFSWMSKAAKRIAPSIGKAVKTAGQVYDKGKAAYSQYKAIASALPVVGQVVSGLVQQGEKKLGDLVQSRTGMSLEGIDQGIGKVRETVANMNAY